MSDRQYLDKVEAAYQGEVYGEAMYAAIARSRTDADQARKWRVLVRLEIQVKQEMRALVARLGGNTIELAGSRNRGLADALAYQGLPWDALMHRFAAELEPVIAEYAELESLAGKADLPTLARLTRHEVVTKQFCELELAGQPGQSLDPVLEFLQKSL